MFRKYFILVMLMGWTVFCVIIGGLKYSYCKEHHKEHFFNVAKMSFQKDVAYRKWFASHDGVYVPITDKTLPNPYLSHIKNRDVTTKDGQKLTLINPSYMTRKVLEQNQEIYGYGAHITGLTPLNPKNHPDDWEKKVLTRLSKTKKNSPVSEFVAGEMISDFRYMQPFQVKKSCLKCHFKYKVGEVHCGLSVTIPKEDILKSHNQNINETILVLWILWLIGTFVIFYLTKKILSLFNNLEISKNKEVTVKDKKLSLAVSAAGIGTWEYNLITEVAIYDEEWCNMLGYALREVETNMLFWEKLIHSEDMSMIKDARNKHLQGDTEYYEAGYRCKHKNGHWIWIFSKGRIIEWNKKEEPVKIIGIHLNISKQKEMEKELIEAKEKAELANVAKSDFLANMSHEIRTPMNGLIGTAEILKTISNDRKILRYAHLLSDSSSALLTILNDIIDYSKIESGRIRLEKTPFDLLEIIENVSDLLSIKTQDTDVELIVKYPSNKLLAFIGDSLRIRQCLTNLLGNAVKFTHEGHIIIETIIRKVDDTKANIFIKVSDTGIGIGEEQKKHIFNKFAQADASTTRKYGGSGLGLTITKKLVELMGGSLEVESTLGKGSCFTMNFHLEVKEYTAKYKDLSNIKILSVEDNSISQEVLKEYCEHRNAFFVGASNPDDGLRAVRTQEFDLILMDHKLPSMTGIELSKIIKKDNNTKNIPIILLTSIHCQQEELDDLFIEVIQKPIRFSMLDTIIFNIVKNVKENTLVKRTKPSFNVNILIVDDVKSNLIIAEAQFSHYKCNINTATNGLDAIEKFKENKYDIIFMDYMMPELDGCQTTKRIRDIEEQEKLEQIPIIALTGKGMDDEKKEFKDCGMNDCIIKPLLDEKIYAILSKYCNKHESKSSEMKLISNTKQFDVILNLNKQNPDLIDLTVKDGDYLIKQLDSAITDIDYDVIKNSSHSLKSIFKTLGCDSIADIAINIEASNKDLENVKKQYPKLISNWDLVKKEIETLV